MNQKIYEMGGEEPLDQGKNLTLIKRYKRGEDVMEELIMGNYRLLITAAKSFFATIDPDDAMQEAVLAMIKAVDTYDEEKGAFSTFVYRCVRNRLISYKSLQDKRVAGDRVAAEEVRRSGRKDSGRLDAVNKATESVVWLRDNLNTILPDGMERLIFSVRHGLYDGVARTKAEVATIAGIEYSELIKRLDDIEGRVRDAYEAGCAEQDDCGA